MADYDAKAQYGRDLGELISMKKMFFKPIFSLNKKTFFISEEQIERRKQATQSEKDRDIAITQQLVRHLTNS